MAAKGLFITATDTGIGKTIVAATLARLLKERGIDVGVMKPVTSGCLQRDGRLISEDAELLAWAAGVELSDDVAPYILTAPIAPSMAAEQEGVRIDLNHIVESYQRLASHHQVVIVEGAGGLMVPLAGGLLVADLIGQLKLPLLVVTRPQLGTVSHTLLTCYSARQMGLDLRGFIINSQPTEPGPAETYAPHLLDSLAGAPLLGILPHSTGQDQRQLVEKLVQYLHQQPATAITLRQLGVA
jgi:dethiobiotin synthetase